MKRVATLSLSLSLGRRTRNDEVDGKSSLLRARVDDRGIKNRTKVRSLASWSYFVNPFAHSRALGSVSFVIFRRAVTNFGAAAVSGHGRRRSRDNAKDAC